MTIADRQSSPGTKKRETIVVYTDGACSGNPGPGGWAAILVSRQWVKEIWGSEEKSTNNRMELTAVLEAMNRLKKPSTVTIYSDSAYLINAFTQNWVFRWEKNGWTTKEKGAVKNRELWENILKAVRIHTVVWMKVEGHAGVALNERADELAQQAMKEREQGEMLIEKKKYTYFEVPAPK